MIDGVVRCGDLLQGLTLVTFWPPEGLFDGPRKLLVRAARGGFLSPSLDGGLPLLELFNPSRRSSSARRAFRAAISAAWVATSAISSSCDGQERESGSFIESLNRNPIPLSRKIYPHSLQRNLSTWAVTIWAISHIEPGLVDFSHQSDRSTGSNLPASTASVGSLRNSS